MKSKNFLLLAIGLGVAGIIIGGITLVGSIQTVLSP